MAGKEKNEGTHTIELDASAAANEPETIEYEVNNHKVQVSPELAKILDEQKTHYAGQQTKSQEMMAEAKTERTNTIALLEKDMEWYKTHPQETWEAYMPAVEDGRGTYNEALGALKLQQATDGSLDVEDNIVSKPQAMTPDPKTQADADMRREIKDIRTEMAIGKRDETYAIVDRLNTTPEFNLANRNEIRANIRSYFDANDGQFPSTDVLRSYLKASHDSAKETNTKAGYIVDKTRFQGIESTGGMPREAVKSIGGNIFGTQKEKDTANQELAEALGDKF